MTVIETIQDEMLLIALASKAALLAESAGAFTNEMERQQFIDAANQVRPVLARLDKANPGFIPVPHDGVEWKRRTE